MKKVALFLIGFIGCSCALFSGLYKIDVYRMENNLPVVFSVWRTDYTPQTGNQTEQPENGLVSFEPAIETESIRGLNAVSYTHLDVYKRQICRKQRYVAYALFFGRHKSQAGFSS